MRSVGSAAAAAAAAADDDVSLILFGPSTGQAVAGNITYHST